MHKIYIAEIENILKSLKEEKHSSCQILLENYGLSTDDIINGEGHQSSTSFQESYDEDTQFDELIQALDRLMS